ncbi:HPP family protein [Oryzibacter oryziterrae]|uniref:HPP family protein n=1 Tax=Oryzibacter oryziterrae TaxID=2766474 RepID=UPI001F212BF5|nr:HPP family protein [Oryzibacter oryziterrae]
MKSFFTRHQAHQPLRHSLLAGLGGLIAVGIIGASSVYAHALLIMAPFGASCVLLFSLPSSPLSQPINVVGGHVLAALIGLLLRLALPDAWWAAALAVGLAIALMTALRITHPPAGATPLVVFAANPGFGFLVLPVLSGACVLVGVATVFHRLSGTVYPMRKG